jgi:putative aldouronate transport system permease protein
MMNSVVKRKLKIGPPKEGMVEKQTISGMVADVLIYIFLAVMMFCCIIPLWHVLMSSISDGKRLLAHDGLLWLPAGNATLEGYKLLFKDASIMKGYGNTLIYVVGGTLLGLFINATGGYVLSRPSKLKPLLMMLVMFTMLFSGGLIPTYMVIRNLQMTGTRWSLIIPGCTNAFFLILMMNAFNGVPASTVESARIDGAGHIRTLFQIMLPQCITLTTVVILNSVILQWNSWFNASIYVTNKRDLWPLQLWIRQVVADNQGILLDANPDYNRYLIQYSIIIAATLPILCAFPFFQKKMEAGVIGGAVKE